MTAQRTEFIWTKSLIPIQYHIAIYFFYAAIVLFLAFGLIPNFLPVPDSVFRICMIVLILLTDRFIHRNYSLYTPQGKLVLETDRFELVSLQGNTEHVCRYDSIQQLQVSDNLPMSLFHFFSNHRTQIVVFAFKDGRKMQFECSRKASYPDERILLKNALDNIVY